MNEFFLIAIAILCSLIKGNDRAPALVYALVAHLFYFVSLWSDNVASMFVVGAISDLLVVILLACLSGCLRSRITYFLMPLSVLSMIIHFWGWSLFQSGGDFGLFNSLVVFYMCIIVAMFAFSAGGYGNIHWDHRLLPRDNRRRSDMAMVAK